MLKKVYYYKYSDLLDYTPFVKQDFISSLEAILNTEDLSLYQVPSDLTASSQIYNDLFNLVLSRYNHHAILKIVKCFNEEPSNEEKQEGLKEFFYRYLALLNDTYLYYMTLLKQYNDAKNYLMDDITATSKNKVKFNDTPQNPNNLQVYEGDNYITHFTSTEGENSSPLMSKMMRLKEIQDNYRDLMSEWVRDFERIYFQEDW